MVMTSWSPQMISEGQRMAFNSLKGTLGCSQSSINIFQSFFSLPVNLVLFFFDSNSFFQSIHEEGIMADESGVRFAPVETSLITFSGCRMANNKALMPPSLHPRTN